MKRFSAVYIAGGAARRMTFDAVDESEAKTHAERWGVGLEGEANDPRLPPAPLPEAYDIETRCRLLGGISKVTLWRWLTLNRLDRVPDVRRVLITRRSIERLASSATAQN